jgi:hypothetical protein
LVLSEVLVPGIFKVQSNILSQTNGHTVRAFGNVFIVNANYLDLVGYSRTRPRAIEGFSNLLADNLDPGKPPGGFCFK